MERRYDGEGVAYYPVDTFCTRDTPFPLMLCRYHEVRISVAGVGAGGWTCKLSISRSSLSGSEVDAMSRINLTRKILGYPAHHLLNQALFESSSEISGQLTYTMDVGGGYHCIAGRFGGVSAPISCPIKLRPTVINGITYQQLDCDNRCIPLRFKNQSR